MEVAKNSALQDADETSATPKTQYEPVYIRTHRSFLYLFLTMDVYSRKIVGYHVSRDLKAHGAVQALKNASKFLRPGDCVILHSDCGSQYASHEFASAVRSVSRSV